MRTHDIRINGTSEFTGGAALLLAAVFVSSGCTPAPKTAFWRAERETSAREDWSAKWDRMSSERALIISFTGYRDHPVREDAINNAVERELRDAGLEVGAGTAYEFLELGWRLGHRSAWKAIQRHIEQLPEGVEPRLLLFGHSRGAGRALDIAALLAERGIPVAGLAMVDENKPWALTVSRDRIPENVKQAFNARGGTWWSDFSGLRGRAFSKTNPQTLLNADQDFPGVSHADAKDHPGIVAGIAEMIATVLEQAPAADGRLALAGR